MFEFIYNTSIALTAFCIGMAIAVLAALAMFFSRSGQFDAVHANRRLVGLMASGLGLAFGAILTRATAMETPWLALIFVGACTAYYLWLVLNMMFRSGRHWPTILLCVSLLLLTGGLLCETLIVFHDNWALGVTISWFTFPVAALATVVTMIVKRTKARRIQRNAARRYHLT